MILKFPFNKSLKGRLVQFPKSTPTMKNHIKRAVENKAQFDEHSTQQKP